MKNIFLSVVVICALVIAGIGGTLAGLSDTESSVGNYMAMGSLDLEISPGDGTWYDDDADGDIGVAMAESGLHWPCQWTDPIPFYLHSKSEPDGKTAHAYVCLKDFTYSDIAGTKPLHLDGTTEPEDVESDGGWLANKEICGWTAKPAAMAHLVEVKIYWDDNGNGVLDAGEKVAGPVNLGELWDPDSCGGCGMCWFDLGPILACNSEMGWISMHLIQLTTEVALANDEDGWLTVADLTGSPLFSEGSPFRDHWTNAFQLDKAEFEMCFALTQDPMDPDDVYPTCYPYTPG